MMLYRLESVAFAHRGSHGRVPVLTDIDLAVGHGECVALAGPSGSGKSTLLHLMAGMRRPCTGRVLLDDRDLTTLSDRELARTRAQRIGMVFQSFQLLPHLSAIDNVLLPTWIAGRNGPAARERALGLLASVGLTARAGHRPAQLSGGEQQRVAIARALVNEPDVVLADEPTGNLDAAATDAIARLLSDLCATGRTVIVATHDPRVAAVADRVIGLDVHREARPATR